MLIPIKPENYKDQTVEQPEFDRLYIPAKIIQAAKLFQANGDARFYLNAIHFNNNGFIEATNGHIAIRIECEECKRLSKSLILEIKGSKIPAKAQLLEFVSLSNKKGVILMRGHLNMDIGEVRSFEVLRLLFPDLSRVLPKGEPLAVNQIKVNAKYMDIIYKAQKIIGGEYSGITMKFFDNSKGAIEIDIEGINVEHKATVILMPMKF